MRGEGGMRIRGKGMQRHCVTTVADNARAE
jgi:hypothetical protein